MSLIRLIEELSFNAWPSLQTVYDDGWLLRFADGYGRRANSVNPIYPSSQPVAPKIDRCEALYHQRRLNAVFKLTPASEPSNLDTLLAQRGYHEEGRTSLQTIDLATLDVKCDPAVSFENHIAEAWLAVFCRLSLIDPHRIPLLHRMLSNIIPPIGCAALRLNGEIAAMGLGVVDQGYVGLFDIVTDAGLRNQGMGRRLVHSILYWGRENGANCGYLQVMLSNAPALHLYQSIGFREVYQYWYRSKTPD